MIGVIGMGLAGALLHPLTKSSSRDRLDGEPILAAVENGSSVAVLGGLKTVVADLLWLRAYLAWASKLALMFCRLNALSLTLIEP